MVCVICSFYIFKCFVMFCNVVISKLGIKLGFRTRKVTPMHFVLEVTFQGQNSVCMGQSVYLTCETGVINIYL